MKQRWTFRCYPSDEQARELARTFGCARFVYNWGLEQRTKAFQRGERMNYVQSSAALTELKRQPETAWLNEVSSVPVQQALRHLQTAFRNFFEQRSGYPAFKRKDGRQTAEYTRSAFRFETVRRAVEDLNLRGLVKNHRLARSLSDAAIGRAIRTIETKAAMHGKSVVKIDRWFPSSKLCSACGMLQARMPLSIREWTCECGAVHDRDENAARNLLAVGHTVTGRGASVSLH